MARERSFSVIMFDLSIVLQYHSVDAALQLMGVLGAKWKFKKL